MMEDYENPRYVTSIWYSSDSTIIDPTVFLVICENSLEWFVFYEKENRNYTLPKSEYIIYSPLKNT